MRFNFFSQILDHLQILAGLKTPLTYANDDDATEVNDYDNIFHSLDLDQSIRLAVEKWM